ncbi:hypothetical protein IMX07_03460 [bacterium]|jgi:hypothetical protein|nr:hypothetical protein [bacterium]
MRTVIVAIAMLALAGCAASQATRAKLIDQARACAETPMPPDTAPWRARMHWQWWCGDQPILPAQCKDASSDYSDYCQRWENAQMEQAGWNGAGVGAGAGAMATALMPR